MQTHLEISLPDSELQAALEQVFSQRGAAIREFRRRFCPYSSTYPIEELDVELADGQCLGIIFKDLSPGSLRTHHHRIRPPFLYDPWREIEAYQCLLPGRLLDTPSCYGSVIDLERDRYWLFLERVDGPPLWQMGDFACWQEAARWLARWHNEFATDHSGNDEVDCTHLLQYDESYLSVWLDRAMRILGAKRGIRHSPLWARWKKLAGSYDRIIEALLEVPRTILHGEFYPSNILMRPTRLGHKVCPIDWETIGWGPGLIDLAALVSGDWEESDRIRLIVCYRESLEPVQGWPPPLADLVHAVDICQIHLSIKMLGWNPDWSPPAWQARDWLQEAFRLSERRARLTL